MNTGKCHVCGKMEALSYEHVPPKSAFNYRPVKIYDGNQIIENIKSQNFPWDFSRRKWKEKQRGMGFYSLCENCNNNTGTWYGSAFSDFIKQGFRDAGDKDFMNTDSITLKFKNIYPLRIAKQLISLFASINRPEFFDNQPELLEFVLDKEKKISLDHKLCIYLWKGQVLSYFGNQVVVSVETGNSCIVSELCLPPFGFVLKNHTTKEDNILFDISDFCGKYDYDECTNLELTIPSYFVNSMYPLDYRTQNEILVDRNKNEEYEKCMMR